MDCGIRNHRLDQGRAGYECCGASRRQGTTVSAERDRVAGFGRLEDGLRQAGEWYRWGPYVSERQWGTVREDYSADGEAWDYLPHDHARSRAYRWGEDGLAGFCDVEQRLCLGLALWNGRDPILKERAFGLTGAQGNHGEDVKEYWWYLDALPSHAWNRWRYHYPQAAFPYQDLIDQNGSRSREEPEYELLDTGVFDERPVLDHRGALRQGQRRRPADDRPGDQRRPRDRRPCTCCRPRGSATPGPGTWTRPSRRCGRWVMRRWASIIRSSARWSCWPAPGRTGRCRRRCSARTRPTTQRLFGAAPLTPYPKDGINDHVVSGAATVNPERTGTKCSFWYQVTVQPGETAELRLRLRPPPAQSAPREGGRPARRPVRPGDRPAAGRGRRVLRRADPGRGQRRRGHGDAAGVRRDAVEQAAVLLRRGPLAGRRPDPADAAAAAADRAQLPVAQLRRLRHHVDAGQVGVPLVRGLGPGLPLRRAGARGPGVRQVPADPAVPGVVPAPERGAARLRVGLRRREPAGAGLGRAGGVRHRRRPRHRLPQPGLRQAAGQLHLVGQPGGRRGQQPVRGRLPRPGQHRPDRPLAPAGRRHPGAVRRHRLDGLLRDRHGRHRRRPEPVRAAAGHRSRAEVPRALRRHPRGAGQPGAVGRGRRALLRPAGDAVRAAPCR